MLKIVNAVLVAKAIGPKTKAMRFGLKVGGSRPRPDLEAEQATGQWVKWVTILDGSHGSWVTVC